MFEKLENIAPIIENAIECNAFTGCNVAVVSQNDTVYSRSFGLADKEKNIPMTEDKIFRLFSLSKPVTAAAAMILLERGKIELRYPIKWFLPTFEAPKVLDENGERPAERDITIGDLLSMTSGIPYPEGTPSGQAMGELWGKQSYNYENGGELYNTYDFALEMGKRPLSFTPGEKWMYGASADIMGAVIEAVSGMKFSEFLKKEIFEPLGMKDTGFYIPEDKYSRLAQVYDRTDTGNIPFTEHNLCTTDYRKPPAFESGGAGLVSTIGDYSNFVKMLINDGTFGNVNIIGRKTAQLMRMNFLNTAQMNSLGWDSMIGHGYGSFMRVLTSPTEAGLNASAGSFGWDGWLGCYFCIDPAEKLGFLYFIQQTNSGCTDITRKVQNIVWSAI